MRKGFPEDARKIVDGIYQLRRNILIYLNQQGRRTLQEISGYVGCDEGDVANILMPELVNLGVVTTELECRDNTPVKLYSLDNDGVNRLKTRIGRLNKLIEGIEYKQTSQE